jgi:hypothetical protein
MAETVGTWPVTANTRVRSRLVCVGFVMDIVAPGEVYLRKLGCCPVSIIPLMLYIVFDSFVFV